MRGSNELKVEKARFLYERKEECSWGLQRSHI